MEPRTACTGVAIALAAILASTTLAGPVTFTASDSEGRAASARFEVVGSNLHLTLTNISTMDVMQPDQILTAVFFDVAGSPTLSPVSAMLGPGSTVFFGPVNGGDVGGEWALEQELSGAPHGASYGVSSAGFNLFGAQNRFGTQNLQGPEAVDGLQYGITSFGDDMSSGNQAVTGQFALIKYQVIFDLGRVGSGFDPMERILNVSFQYGTSLSDPNLPPVIPLPPAALAGLSGLLIVGNMRRRRPEP